MQEKSVENQPEQRYLCDENPERGVQWIRFPIWNSYLRIFSETSKWRKQNTERMLD
jgi:hypothetical protein